jgi:hypothetical protein
MGPVEFGMGRDGRVEVSLGQLWQGLQTAVRRVRPPYCSLGNRSGMAMRVLEWASWGTASRAMAGLLGLRLTPQALNFIY